MAKLEKINGAFFNIEYWKDKTKAEFSEVYKDKRVFHWDIDETWKKIQEEIKKQFPKKETK